MKVLLVSLLATAFTACAVPRLAFQVYGVRDLAAKDLRGTLKAAKALGYEGVETGRFFGLGASELKALCAETGLELVALQLYPYNLTEPELGETIRFCRDCGCRRVNVAWYRGSAENANDWQLLINVLNHAAEVCAKEGIVVAYHNHDHEFSTKLEGRTVWDWLWTPHAADRENAQVVVRRPFSSLVRQEIDPANCILGGGDPIACLKRHPHRNPTIHVSLNVAADWPAILKAAEEDGVEWLVMKPTNSPASLSGLQIPDFLKRMIR